MLRIQTFDAKAGGNVIYKALAHPLAAEAIERLYPASMAQSRCTIRTASPMRLSRCILPTSRPVCARRHCRRSNSRRSDGSSVD